jgi:glutathione synthase/RimK-type ligase-like ATP-grasp enzyme
VRQGEAGWGKVRQSRTRISFVTFGGAPDLTEDDRLAIEPLRRLGYSVDPQVWSDPNVNWEQYGLIVLRSTWDYHKQPHAFSNWLSHITTAGYPLWNPPDLVRWNMDKTYLKELSRSGIPITPTEWLDQGEESNLVSLLDRRGWDRAVVKPTLSATAFHTWIATRESASQQQSELDDMLRRGGVLVQKFEDSIRLGEWSLVFLQEEFSHSVLKVPNSGDFRVQKEYGGTSKPTAAPGQVRAAAERVLAAVQSPWLYARVDLVDSPTGARLMELEMLEPDLFLRHHPEAPERFAAAIAGRVRQGEAG